MSQPRLFLYVKEGCPWCAEAESFLRRHSLAYDKVDVISDAAAFARMREVSGQIKAPVMEFGEDREILADFGEDELAPFLRDRGVIT
ncbi:MAG: glutaredoxin domain-containing protein [Verrucomicrobiota bacterium]